MQLRPTVLLAVTNRRAFMQCYYQRNDESGVWVNGSFTHELGTHVDLEIAFADEQVVLHTRGIVRAKRPTDRGNLRAGIGIDFLHSETKTRDLLLSFAKGQRDLARRRSRRLPVVMEVEVVSGRSAKTEFTENISRDGALLTFTNPPEVGTVVPITLKPQGHSKTIVLRAEVRWRRVRERPAIGVRFIFEEPSEMREVNSLMEALRARLVS